MTAGVIYCSVLGCHRWRRVETMQRKGWTAFVCGSHWRRATIREKAVIARLKRANRRIRAMTGEWDDGLIERESRVWQSLQRRVADRPPVEPRR